MFRIVTDRGRIIARLALPAALAASLFSASAQDAVVLAIEGWRQEERGGITYHRCASAICAAGSVVSYRRQTHRPDLPLAAFETHHRRLSREAPDGPDSQVKSSVVRDFAERKIGGARVLSARRDVAWTDGTTTAHIDALVIGERSSFSVVSDAPRADWARNNFEGFLPRLADMAMLVGRSD